MSNSLKSHVVWLKNTHSAVVDAIDDNKYREKNQNFVYLAFDPSIIFAPLSLRSKPLSVENPDDWLDIASDIVFWSLDYIDIDSFGYKLVLPHATYLTILYNYKIDLDFIESIENSNDIDDIFYKINSKISGGNSHYGSEANATLEEFLRKSDKKHKRLEKLVSYIREEKILLENSVFDTAGMKRTRILKEEFDDLYKEINNLRAEPHSGTPREMFIKAIEVIGIIDSKKKTEDFKDGRYLFLGWPKSRSYYNQPKQYHRVITTLMLKIMSTKLDTSVILVEFRDNIAYLIRRLREVLEENSRLSNLTYQNILTIYESIIGFMDIELKKIFQLENAPVSRSSDLDRLSMRDIVSAARSAKNRTRKTLEELSSEFEVFDTVAGWDELPDDHPIKLVISNAKPTR